ncbi:hypothetical protein [Hyphobacterium sp.]|uniref:hypothetical protein n=1 Tax=Hyphobacterium sp. TaxID=2004662 RepID=UPI003B523A08
MKHILPALGVAVIAAASVAAQDVSQPPSYGSITLNAGFLPDPHSVQMRAGGSIPVAGNVNGAGVCRGHIANAPDYNVYYSAGSFDLYLSAVSQRDTTIVVRDPRGNWYCDDDGAEGLNPGLELSRPASGLYSIWVGTYSTGSGLPPATLYVSEIGFGPRPMGEGGLNPALTANYGSRSLQTGFTPDPLNIPISAGGDVDVREVGPDGCWGYATAAPDFELSYAAGSTFDLYLSATSERDTVMIVNGPDGNWYCNDDGSEGLNPGLRFENPQSGVYDIWVGTYSSSAGTPPATLHISELDFGGDVMVDGNLLDFTLPANYGSVQLENGFLPDPYNVQIAAGGNIDVGENGPDGCWGYTTAAPDYELTYAAGSTFDLYLSATSQRDTVMIVNAPDGNWYCNDDGAAGLNPGLMFENPQSGVYDIWVGTYSSSAGTPAATLHISEIEFGDN